MNKIFITIILVFLVCNGKCLGVIANRNKEACIGLPSLNRYNFEYLVVSQNPQNIQCSIWENQTVLNKRIIGQPHHQEILNTTSKNWKICFIATDDKPKRVQFDLMAMDDPMRHQILQKDLNKLNQQIQSIYRSMSLLYRNQHFYYQKNRSQRDRLDSIQTNLKLIKVVKIIIVALAGFLQCIFVKRFVNKKTKVQQYISVPN